MIALLRQIENWARRNFKYFDRRKTVRQVGAIRYCRRVGEVRTVR